jgi:hypothetical protein
LTVEEEALIRVARALEGESIPYMVAGSIASSYHGRPRATHDADLVIDPAPAQLTRLLGRLVEDGFSVDAERARDALRRRRQFNVIDVETGWKVDLIFRKERPFSREELRRRQVAQLGTDITVAMATPEDTILSKLEWARLAGGSERQLADARGVLEVNPGLDRGYLERWASELGVSDLWNEIAGVTS